MLTSAPDWITSERFDILARLDRDAGAAPDGIDSLRGDDARVARGSVHVVVDRTGFTGGWDLELHFAAAPSADSGGGVSLGASDAPSMYTAVQEQLGLKLEPAKGPVEMLVIEKRRPPDARLIL